ncbi:BspA family leucine-rich repeat surface protein [Candidatus Enterococcus ferrettii]|nr:BspA family leucine-rich repeat surface protein [Enterococcus sp. 665A]MBO1342262.1 BspA family leucine-rich repeat surface protein [Enterococcus sp. 665A]
MDVTYGEEINSSNDSLIQNEEKWETETTEEGRAKIIGYSESVNLNELVIPSSINGLPVEVNLKEIFGETLQTQIRSFTIEHSKANLQPVKLTGEFNSLFSKHLQSSKIKRIDFGDADTSSITTMDSMFLHCRSLNFLNLGENFNTVNVKNMRRMFDGIKLKQLDLGKKFITSNVETMEEMFYGCSNLESLDLGEQFYTQNVRSMRWMFFQCQKLKQLDLGDHFDTQNVQTMTHMFSTCNSLTELDLGELFDTRNVTDISGMFLNCVELKRLDLGDHFDTSNVKDMMYTFENCEKLENLHLGNKFHTSEVETMDAMFSECKRLSDFSFLASFDTSQVKSMYSMFQDCLAVERLELNFDTQNVLTMWSLFSGCTNLKELTLGEKFDSKKMTVPLSFSELFKDCKKLRQLTIPSAFKLSENSALKEVPLEEKDYYWAYKKEQPLTTKELIIFHNNQPENSMNKYELKKAYQIRYEVTNNPAISSFPEQTIWENQIFEEIPKEYTKEGYDIQWSVDGKLFNEPISVTKSIVLSGQATPISYTITFDSAGGEKVNAITYTIQDSIDSLPVPIRKGYLFDGWCDEEGKISTISKGTTGNKTLSAEWLVDKTSLNERIKKEQALNRVAVSYTTTSWETYSKALEEASAALEEERVTLKSLTAIEKRLVQAIKQLKELPPSTLSFEGLIDCTIEKGEAFDPKAGVKAIDSIEGELTHKIKIVGTVDSSKVGSYLLTYSVENSANNKIEKAIYVHVIESDESNNVYVHHTIEIPELTLPRYSDYKQIIKDKMIIKNSNGDSISSETVAFSISSEKDTTELGDMTALVTISYENGTSVNQSVKITIISGIEIIQSDIACLFYVGDKKESFDPYSVFQAFEISSDGTKTTLGPYDTKKEFGIEVIDNPIDFSKPGEYIVRYQVTNSLGEKVAHSYTVKVNASKELKLKATDKIMYVGDILTEEKILSWAKTENADKLEFEELGQAIPIDTKTNQLTSIGEYNIRYKAYQVTGETEEVTIKLTVQEQLLSSYPISMNDTKNKANMNKKGPSSSAKKSVLPKTGSEKTNSFVYLIGFFLAAFAIHFVKFVKEKEMEL